jgi:hypothetical protein
MLVTQVAREAAGQAQTFQIRRPNNGFDRHRRSLRDVSLRAVPRDTGWEFVFLRDASLGRCFAWHVAHLRLFGI